jgi:hypothetical protein
LHYCLCRHIKNASNFGTKIGKGVTHKICQVYVSLQYKLCDVNKILNRIMNFEIINMVTKSRLEIITCGGCHLARVTWLESPG